MNFLLRKDSIIDWQKENSWHTVLRLVILLLFFFLTVNFPKEFYCRRNLLSGMSLRLFVWLCACVNVHLRKQLKHSFTRCSTYPRLSVSLLLFLSEDKNKFFDSSWSRIKRFSTILPIMFKCWSVFKRLPATKKLIAAVLSISRKNCGMFRANASDALAGMACYLRLCLNNDLFSHVSICSRMFETTRLR